MNLGFLKGRERMVVATLAGILFMILQAFVPELQFTETQSYVFAGLIASYVLGEGMSQQKFAESLENLVRSQKFQMLVVGLVLIFVKGFYPDFNMSEEQVVAAIGVLASFIISAGARS